MTFPATTSFGTELGWASFGIGIGVDQTNLHNVSEERLRGVRGGHAMRETWLLRHRVDTCAKCGCICVAKFHLEPHERSRVEKKKETQALQPSRRRGVLARVNNQYQLAQAPEQPQFFNTEHSGTCPRVAHPQTLQRSHVHLQTLGKNLADASLDVVGDSPSLDRVRIIVVLRIRPRKSDEAVR